MVEITKITETLQELHQCNRLGGKHITQPLRSIRTGKRVNVLVCANRFNAASTSFTSPISSKQQQMIVPVRP